MAAMEKMLEWLTAVEAEAGKDVARELARVVNEHLEQIASRKFAAMDPGRRGDGGESSVEGPSDAELVQRVVEDPPLESGLPRWSRVRGVFGLGSTSASRLCERFGMDPDSVDYECPACGVWHGGHDTGGECCSEKCVRELDGGE